MSQKKLKVDDDVSKPSDKPKHQGLGFGSDAPKSSSGQMSTATGIDGGVPESSKPSIFVEKVKSKFKVVTYQIPVPVGDCSAHLLVERGDKDKWVFGENSRAILMDGGRDSDGIRAGLMISNAIRKIREDWGDSWQFNAWVITHWDSDHYMGALNLFKRGEGILDDEEEPDTVYGKALTLGEKGSGADFVKAPKLYAGAPPIKLVSKLEKIGFTALNTLTGKGVIGIDLFTGIRVLEAETGNPIKARETERPVFCCLAAGGYAMDTPKLFKRPTVNETSILSLLYWPKERHAAYFTGGDGHPKITNTHVIPYLRKQGFIDGFNGITAVKLDHHGSSKEWTAGIKTGKGFGELPCFNMTLAANPKRVLVTPGDQYGHPCWDVIMCLYAYYHYRLAAEKATLFSTRVPYWNDSDLFLSTKDMNINQTRVKIALDQFNTTYKEVYSSALYEEHPSEMGEVFRVLESIFQSHREAMEDAEKERRRLGKKIGDTGWVPYSDEGVVTEDDLVPTKEELEELRKKLDKAELESTKQTKMSVEGDRPTELAMAGDRIWRASKDLATITSLWWDWLSPQQLSSTYGEQGPYILLKLESTNDDTDGTIIMYKADGSAKADFSHIPKRQMPTRGKDKVDYGELLKKLEKMRQEELEKAKTALQETGKDEFGSNRNRLRQFYETIDLSEGAKEDEDEDYEMDGGDGGTEVAG